MIVSSPRTLPWAVWVSPIRVSSVSSRVFIAPRFVFDTWAFALSFLSCVTICEFADAASAAGGSSPR